MDGMSTQDLLNGQDLSTANVDDLLAAMGANEAAQAAPVEEAAPPSDNPEGDIAADTGEMPETDHFVPSYDSYGGYGKR